MERAPQADRGAAAPPRLRLLHDRALEGAADGALALPDLRLLAAAPRGAVRSSCARSRTARRSTCPTRRSRSSRARARGSLPRRGLDPRPARRRDGAARSRCRPCSSCSARSRRRRSSGSATSSSTATPPGALSFVEELAEQGQDLGRLVTDLLEHLRYLMLVQHMGEVPESLPVTRGDARAPARAGEPARRAGRDPRSCDLLAVAIDDMRQGGDPRLPLELALVKVTRPGADLSRQSLAFRIEQLERDRSRGEPHHAPGRRGRAPKARTAPRQPRLPPSRSRTSTSSRCSRSGASVLPAVGERSIPTASVLGEAKPIELSGNRLVIEFPPAAVLPPQPRRGAEERDASRRGPLRGHGPQARARLRGRRGRRRGRRG